MAGHLVGREDDLRRAQAVLTDRGVVVIAGAAGVGASAVARALAEDWLGDGGTILSIRGTHGLHDVPFGAIAAAIPDAGGGADAVAAAMSVMSDSEGSTLVVVDDAHLLDPASAGVLSGLAQSPSGRFIVVVTSGEASPVDITSIWAESPELRIDLAPLSRGETADLVGILVDRDLEPAMREEIYDLTLGYPLYVAAVASEIAGLSSEAPLGSLSDITDRSDRLVRLMERRLSRLGREERRVLDAIALAESVSIQIVTSEFDASVFSNLERAGLVEVFDGRAAISHPLLASVARGTLTLNGRRESVASLLAGVSHLTLPRDVADLVRDALSVGVVPGADLLETAAQVALSWRDYEGALRIASQGPEDSRLAVLHAKASRFLGELPDEFPPELDETARTEFLSARSQVLAYGERRFGEAIRLLQEAVASLSAPVNRNRIATELMILSGLAGDIDALLSAGRSVTEEADPDTRLLALAVSQLAEGLTLSTSAAQETYAAGMSVSRSVDQGSVLIEQLEMSRGLVDLADGRLAEARARLGGSASRAVRGSWLTIESLLADSWLSADEALTLAESAVEALGDFDPFGNLPMAIHVADLRRAQAGETVDGRVTVEQPIEIAPAEIDRLMIRRADAWYSWGAGDETAGKFLIELGREAVVLGHRFWGLAAFLDAIRLGHGDEVLQDVDHLAITRGAGLAVLASRHARARTPHDHAAMARMWWDAGAPTYAVESAIRAAETDAPVDCAAVQLLEALGAVPLVVDGSDCERPLSRRQVEIALGTLKGASNEETADALFLSRRTVENHLHRIYRALGTEGGREGLVEFLGWVSQNE